MKYRVHAAQRIAHRLGIAYVATPQFHFGIEILRPLAIRAVHLRVEVVQHPHAIAVQQQFVGEM